jgi:N-acetylglucosamine kinase-like BadF-type ATPase
VAVIAGTGSHVFGVDDDGNSWRTGGWGHVLGDEGSGYWIGVQSLKASLRYRDGSGPFTELVGRAERWFELDAIQDLPDLFYGKPLTKAEVAAFAQEVAAAAAAGDEVALQIFHEAGRDLADQALAVTTALGLEHGPVTIALVGSVYEAGALIRTSLEARVREVAPEARFVVPDVPPVAGSLMLALRADGSWADVDEKRFVDTLRAAQAAAERDR